MASLLSQRPGARVLDCFSFAGGFGLHCAQAGAARVHMLDQSEGAITAARRNAELNGLTHLCSFEVDNVSDWLKHKSGQVGSVGDYDVVVLDPPPFAPNRGAVKGALRGYKEIHLRAMKLMAADGLLATFCCSHHVHAQLFEEVIAAAARDAHRTLRRVAVCGQSADHPVVVAIPETEYLKGFVYEVSARVGGARDAVRLLRNGRWWTDLPVAWSHPNELPFELHRRSRRAVRIGAVAPAEARRQVRRSGSR